MSEPVIHLTADAVRFLTRDAMVARGLPGWAIDWIVGHRQAGAVRIDVPMVTVTPLSVLKTEDQ